MFTIADLIQSGVRALPWPEVRHHRVRDRLDGHHAQAARLELHPHGGAKTFGIPLKPSAYWKRNFYVTFEDDPIGIRTRDFIGTNTLLWGNDYPHGDSVFPHSQQVLNEVSAGLHARRALRDDREERRAALQSAVRGVGSGDHHGWPTGGGG